jgi:hypothetical protein
MLNPLQVNQNICLKLIDKVNDKIDLKTTFFVRTFNRFFNQRKE